MHTKTNITCLPFFLTLALLLSSSNMGAQENIISIGLHNSIDLNFYKFSDGNFRDDERKGRFKFGYTYGLITEIHLTEKIALNIGIHYSKKRYTPERLFSFGTLQEVHLNAIEIPMNAKYNFIQGKNKGRKYYVYVMLGLLYQIEKKRSFNYSNLTGSPYVPSLEKYLLPSISCGINYNLTKKLSARIETTYRKGKCHCEYLNRVIDKISISISFMANI